MTEKELQNLDKDDIVRHKKTGFIYTIMGKDKELECSVGIGKVLVISSPEWDLFSKSEKHVK